MENTKGELVPGGLAMVIGDPTGKFNGIIVETLRIVVNGEKFGPYQEYRGSPAWECRADGLEAKCVGSGRNLPGVAFIRPANLMPIKPEADPLHAEQDQCTSA